MKYVPYLSGVLAGLLLSVLLGFGLWHLIIAVLLGALAGHLSTQLSAGSERVYWVGVGVTLGVWIVGAFFWSLPGALVIMPVIFMASYFVARLVGRFVGTRPT